MLRCLFLNFIQQGKKKNYTTPISFKYLKKKKIFNIWRSLMITFLSSD